MMDGSEIDISNDSENSTDGSKDISLKFNLNDLAFNTIFENKLYKINDWCLYYNSAWNNINTNDNVISVNSKTGIVELTNDDVNAISKDYIK